MTTPTGRATAEDPAQERRRLLDRLLAEEGLDDALSPAPVSSRPVERAPLTFAQETLWLLDRAMPGASAYNSAVGLRLRGPLDPARLANAFDALAVRHDALRTAFDGNGAQPMQIVLPPTSVPVALHDLRSLPGEEREERARTLLRDLAETPFDLEAGRLLRVGLVRIAEQEHLLGVVTHHIISDAWSYGVLFAELGALYDGRSLEPVACRLPAYAAHQRETMRGQALEERLAAWRAHLAGVPPLTLPSDRPAPAVPTEHGARRERTLSPALLEAMRTTARAQGTTVYATLLAAFGAVLRRYGAADDLVIGSAVASRMRPETAGMIGYLSPALPMRLAFAGNPSFGDLLRTVGATVVDALDRQDVPYESVAPGPLFRVVLTMQDARATELRLGEATSEPFAIDAARTKFDLTLLATERAKGLELSLWYRTDLFEAATVERLLGHLETLLTGATAAPNTPVGALPLLSASEREELLRLSAAAWIPTPASVRSAIAAVVARTPNAIALRCGAQRLSYAELAEAAHGLAFSLRAQGVRRGDAVGIFFERSVEAVAALLGVLEAGAAYVPVDPDVPPARAAAQFADASVRVVATTAALAPRLPPGMRVVLAEERRAAGAAYEAEPSRADDPAYVLFTSGSTGTPKGVVVTHGNLANYVAAIGAELERGTAGAAPVRTFATVTALSADLGNTAVFPALCSGGTLHVVPHDVAVDAVRFAAAASAEPFDVLKITPSHLAALLEGGGVGVLPRRILVLGGEPCSWDLVDRIHAAADIHVVNHYGPTEATVGACAYPVGRAGTRAADRIRAGVPIGRPLANVSCYVRDEHGGLAPLGIPGELFIGGAGTARGYIGRPELTAERFSTDPFAGGETRLYRTGDRVRLLASGDLTFLGRLDGQVKVRGYRVELAEIDAALGEHPAVAACAVALHDDALCAYLVLRAGRAGESLAALRARLADRLPEYMLPSALVFLERLPLGPSGKLDRAALPPPLPAEAACAASCAPRTETEAAVAAIWAEALGRERIGTDETFLGLGGHSILAIRVLGKISRRFGVRVSLRTLFGGATVGDIATTIDAAGR